MSGGTSDRGKNLRASRPRDLGCLKTPRRCWATAQRDTERSKCRLAEAGIIEYPVGTMIRTGTTLETQNASANEVQQKRERETQYERGKKRQKRRNRRWIRGTAHFPSLCLKPIRQPRGVAGKASCQRSRIQPRKIQLLKSKAVPGDGFGALAPGKCLVCLCMRPVTSAIRELYPPHREVHTTNVNSADICTEHV